MLTSLSVKQLNMYVKSLLEGDIRLAAVTVTGEISNFKSHYSSGHLYFTLKDNDAAIRCVMFRSFASRVKFEPKDGMKVVLKGRVSIYEKDGQYQFYAEEMTAYGVGDISLKFEQIKQKLSDEGLFDAESKRKLPEFPENIAVVTSDTGAAVRDIINILSRRYPLCRVIMCPVSVQGEQAVPQMLAALERIYALSCVDLIIIGRGGGSIEDLWAFNSETLARKLYESPVPVISAVGHETDFTICDFVADIRASTPSAAAELAVPNKDDLISKINKFKNTVNAALIGKYNYCNERYKALIAGAFFKHPLETVVYNREQYFDLITEKLNKASAKITDDTKLNLIALINRLDDLSPLKVMTRGYTVADMDGKVIRSVKDIDINDKISLRLCDGKTDCSVTGITYLKE